MILLQRLTDLLEKNAVMYSCLWSLWFGYELLVASDLSPGTPDVASSYGSSNKSDVILLEPGIYVQFGVNTICIGPPVVFQKDETLLLDIKRDKSSCGTPSK